MAVRSASGDRVSSEATRARTRVDTVGAWKLRNLPRSLKQIAGDIGAKYVVVAQWAEGRRRPSKEWHGRLHAYSAEFGAKNTIASEEWSEPLGKVRAGREKMAKAREEAMADPSMRKLLVSIKETPVPTTAPEQVLDEAGKLIRDVQSLRDELMKSGNAKYSPSISERAKILSQCATMLDKAARLTGASAGISPAKIIRSPGWNKIKIALADALEPWPDAMRAVADLLKKAVEQ